MTRFPRICCSKESEGKREKERGTGLKKKRAKEEEEREGGAAGINLPVVVQARPCARFEINFNAARMQKGHGRIKRGRDVNTPGHADIYYLRARFIKE